MSQSESLNMSAIKTQDNPRQLTIIAPKTNIPIDIYFERISPAQAKRWLKDNVSNNRAVNLNYVASYAKSMKNGTWDHSNGESIAFNQTGKLVNGQHRLHAIILANKSVWMMIMMGVSKDAILTLDDGNARTLKDAFIIEGVKIKGHLGNHATSVKMLHCLRDCFIEDVVFDTIRKRKTTNTDYIKFYHQLTGYSYISDKLHSQWNINEVTKVMSHTVIVPIFYLFHDIHPEALQEIYQTFYDKIPAGPLGKKSPSWLVMRKLQQMREDGQHIRTGYFLDLLMWTLIKTVEKVPVTQMPTMGWQFKNDFPGRLKAKQKLQQIE